MRATQTYTGWKDETGMPICEGDEVIVHQTGADYKARVWWNGEFGRWMMRLTHVSRPDGVIRPVSGAVAQDIVLHGARITRRVRGVSKMQR